MFLKQCPLCRGKVEVQQNVLGNTPGIVACSECGLLFHGLNLEDFNKRPIEARQQETIDELVDTLDKVKRRLKDTPLDEWSIKALVVIIDEAIEEEKS